MRDSLKDLLKNTLLYRHSIPCIDNKIDEISISTINDSSYECINESQLSELIYNSILEYSFNKFEIDVNDLDKLLAVALKIKIKYKDWQSDDVKIKYGFFGEVLLSSVLTCYYGANALIARGYFYCPLENSETKGYDSYHLLSTSEGTELWFGEVKFRGSLHSGVKSAIDGLQKALSDNYLKNNLYAMIDYRNSFDIKGSEVELILDKWLENPEVDLIHEVNKRKMKLIYPILLAYNNNSSSHLEKVNAAVNHINKEYKKLSTEITINFELFFILVPLVDIKKIKMDVIKWIEEKKPLLS